MEWLQAAMREQGLEPKDTADGGLRSKLLAQADRMLSALAKYKTEAELDGNGSKYWWSAQSVDGQRRIVMRLNGKTITGSATYVDNTLAAVTDAITKMRAVIERTKNEQWTEEEARLKKK
jgi:hypothetical protein